MHHEAAAVAFKPLVIAVGVSVISMIEFFFAQADVAKTFEAIGVYGLPTVLVVYFIARDWYREAIAEKFKAAQTEQAIKDRDELARLTEADKQRSHEARLNTQREQSAIIAAERAKNHELQMALIDVLKSGHGDLHKVSSISDSSTGKFLPKQGNNQ